jgi:hypothetical protein
MALAPFMKMDATSAINPKSLRDAIKDYARDIVQIYQLTPEELAACVTNDANALLVGRLVGESLAKGSENEILLSWKLEEELGL